MNPISFVPQGVRNHLLIESGEYPFARSTEAGIVAIIDISGYSMLSSRLQESLGSDSGAKIKELLNPPIEVIIEHVHHSGGSIVKFAGDAVIAAWHHTTDSTDTQRMGASAFLCCTKLLFYFRNCRITYDEPVNRRASSTKPDVKQSLAFRSPLAFNQLDSIQSANPTSVPKSVMVEHQLKIHIGLGFGKMQQVHLGICEKASLVRAEFFVAGDALAEAGKLLGAGKEGDFVFGTMFSDMFANHLMEDENLPFQQIPVAGGGLALLLNERMDLEKLSHQLQHFQIDKMRLESGSEENANFLPSRHKEQLSRVLPYIDDALAHAIATAEAAIPTDVPQSEFAEQLHAKLKKALASYDQTRNVTVVFIILSDFNVTTIAEDVNLKKLQAAMNAIVKSIHKYQGCLRQINCDDKSLTALLVWGLPGFAHEKDEALFAVPAAMDIRSRLSKILRSNFSIGVTSGSVFAGIVGNTNRADGTVLGVSVNNAARIMCLDMCRGSVLVDSTVFEIASSIFEFDEDIEEVYLKGAGHRKIYRPIKKRAEKNIENTHKRNVWGRDRELAAIGEVISAWKTHNKQRLVITGPSGAGKTMLMNYCLQSLSHDPTTIFCVGVGQEHQQSTMLFCFSDLIQDMINFVKIYQIDVKGYHSATNLSRAGSSRAIDSKAQTNLSRAGSTRTQKSLLLSSESMSGTDNSIHDFIVSTFPSAAWDVWSAVPGLMKPTTTRPIVNDLIERLTMLLVRVLSVLSSKGFQTCLVIDDLQWIDSFSLELTLRLFHACPKVFFLVLSRPKEEFKDAAKPMFQKLLDSPGTVHLDLKPLDVEGVEALIFNAFKPLNTDCTFRVDPKLSSKILEQSQGNSLVASSLITMLKEDTTVSVEKGILIQMGGTRETRKSSAAGMSSVIVAQFDKLIPDMRSILLVAAVAGQYFDYTEVQHVLALLDDQTNLTAEKILKTLDSADTYQFVKKTNRPIVKMFSHFLIQQGILSTLVPSKRNIIHSLFADLYEAKLCSDNYSGCLQSLIFHLTKLDGHEARKQKYLYAAFMDAAESFRSKEAFEYYNEWNALPNKIEFAITILEKARKMRMISQLLYQDNQLGKAMDQMYESLASLGYVRPIGAFGLIRMFSKATSVLKKQLRGDKKTIDTLALKYALQHFPKAFESCNVTLKDTSTVEHNEVFQSALLEVLLQFEFVGISGRTTVTPELLINHILMAIITPLTTAERNIRLSASWEHCSVTYLLFGFKNLSNKLADSAKALLEGDSSTFDYSSAHLSSYTTAIYAEVFDMRGARLWVHARFLEGFMNLRWQMQLLADAGIDWLEKAYNSRNLSHTVALALGKLKEYACMLDEDKAYFEILEEREMFVDSLVLSKCLYLATQHDQVGVEEIHAEYTERVKIRESQEKSTEPPARLAYQSCALFSVRIYKVLLAKSEAEYCECTKWAEETATTILKCSRGFSPIEKCFMSITWLVLIPFLTDWILQIHRGKPVPTSTVAALVIEIKSIAKSAYPSSTLFKYFTAIAKALRHLLKRNIAAFSQGVEAAVALGRKNGRGHFYTNYVENQMLARVVEAKLFLSGGRREDAVIKDGKVLRDWFELNGGVWEAHKLGQALINSHP